MVESNQAKCFHLGLLSLWYFWSELKLKAVDSWKLQDRSTVQYYPLDNLAYSKFPCESLLKPPLTFQKEKKNREAKCTRIIGHLFWGQIIHNRRHRSYWIQIQEGLTKRMIGEGEILYSRSCRDKQVDFQSVNIFGAYPGLPAD